MSSSTLTPQAYINHHLQNLSSATTPVEGRPIVYVDFSLINWDSVFWSVLMGVLALLFLWKASRKATSGVPGRFQMAVEILLDMVREQADMIIPSKESNKYMGPLALTVFLWIVFMNTLDLVPVDLFGQIFTWTGLAGSHHEPGAFYFHRILPTADLNITIGMAVGVLVLSWYYGIKIKGFKGFSKDLMTAPFHAHGIAGIILAPANFVFNLIEFAAKTISLGMRLFGNMFAGELIFMLIALMGSYFTFSGIGFGLATGHLLAGLFWALFHILVIILQAFIFMMLTLVYIGQAHESH